MGGPDLHGHQGLNLSMLITDHYNQGRFEVIDVIEDWNLGFAAGNAVKYIARHKYKGKPVEDLKKARWYIDRLIQNLELEEEDG